MCFSFSFSDVWVNRARSWHLGEAFREILSLHERWEICRFEEQCWHLQRLDVEREDQQVLLHRLDRPGREGIWLRSQNGKYLWVHRIKIQFFCVLFCSTHEMILAEWERGKSVKILEFSTFHRRETVQTFSSLLVGCVYLQFESPLVSERIVHKYSREISLIR